MTKTEQVLKQIKEGPKHGTTIYHLRKALDMPHQTITARLCELLDLGLVVEVGERTENDTSFTVYRFVEDQEDQEFFSRLRQSQKFKKWLKQGEKFRDLMSYELIKELQHERITTV